MKTIGMIGGMSWESTVPYYRVLNQEIRELLGGLHSAKILLYSVDFHEIECMQHTGNWQQAGALLAEAAVTLERAGADFIILCTNTMHMVAPAIESAVGIPLLHIADPAGDEICRSGFRTVGLLATSFTMERDFYRQRLEQMHGLGVLTPEYADRQMVHRVIYEELCLGRVLDASRDQYRKIIHDLVARGAEAILFGCTEIAMLIGPEDSPVPVFDTAVIHARAAARHAVAAGTEKAAEANRA